MGSLRWVRDISADTSAPLAYTTHSIADTICAGSYCASTVTHLGGITYRSTRRDTQAFTYSNAPCAFPDKASRPTYCHADTNARRNAHVCANPKPNSDCSYSLTGYGHLRTA